MSKPEVKVLCVRCHQALDHGERVFCLHCQFVVDEEMKAADEVEPCRICGDTRPGNPCPGCGSV